MMADDNQNADEVKVNEEVTSGDVDSSTYNDENVVVVDENDSEIVDERAPYVHPEGARDYRVPGNDVRDYIGVDPEYMTYASHTEAPMLTDTERFLHTSQYDHLEGNMDGEDDENADGVPDDEEYSNQRSDPEAESPGSGEGNGEVVSDDQGNSQEKPNPANTFPAFNVK